MDMGTYHVGYRSIIFVKSASQSKVMCSILSGCDAHVNACRAQYSTICIKNASNSNMLRRNSSVRTGPAGDGKQQTYMQTL